MAKTLRVCANGHQYYKSSDCPTCPICEQEKKPQAGFLSLLSAPARRALERAGISNVEALAGHREKELLSLHGMGPASLPVLKAALKASGLKFKD
ncbi:RNA polymerase alpha subunit C-terminal domain-containing protein [Niabella hirudinis]|uniref:RNA polymerase alpha subunit C-terminal domain-containing protein n=1 Tax=Niabella hirudinis TaxID=1285929 RepID=UPI003EBE5B16